MPYKNYTLDDGDKYEYYDVGIISFFLQYHQAFKHNISDYFSLPISKSRQSFAALTLFHIVHLYLILPYFLRVFILPLYCLPTLDQTCHRSFAPSFFHAWPVHWCHGNVKVKYIYKRHNIIHLLWKKVKTFFIIILLHLLKKIPNVIIASRFR